MRNIILIAACLLELVLVVYCITSKSNRTVAGFLCAIVAVILFFLTIWLLLFPKYELPSATGEYKVSTITSTYIDTNRTETYTDTNENRTLQVKFWYPENIDSSNYASYPLVVFSHGSYGVKESNVALFNELASNGYVVCSMDHTYQCFSTTDINGNKISLDKGFLQETMKQDSSKKEESLEYFKKWMDIRTGDINFVIDTILNNTKESNSSDLYKLIDTNKIGVIGHSLGGSGALGIGRIRSDVSAVIALESPFMCDIIGVENGEFLWNETPYPVPVLNVYSDSSWNNLGKWSQYAENYKMLNSPQDTEFSIHLKGSGHFTLTDLALSCPIFSVINGQDIFLDGKEFTSKLNNICLEFFNSYLKETNEFKAHETY